MMFVDRKSILTSFSDEGKNITGNDLDPNIICIKIFIYLVMLLLDGFTSSQ